MNIVGTNSGLVLTTGSVLSVMWNGYLCSVTMSLREVLIAGGDGSENQSADQTYKDKGKPGYGAVGQATGFGPA